MKPLPTAILWRDNQMLRAVRDSGLTLFIAKDAIALLRRNTFSVSEVLAARGIVSHKTRPADAHSDVFAIDVGGLAQLLGNRAAEEMLAAATAKLAAKAAAASPRGGQA